MTYDYIVETARGATKTMGRWAMLARWAAFTSRSFHVRLRRRGEEYGDWVTVPNAQQTFRAQTAADRAGVRVFTQRRRDGKEFVVTKVERDVVPDLGCEPALEKIHHAVFDVKYPGRVRSGGRYFCRFVDGTTVVSRHGYRTDRWQGAAEDIFVTDPNTMAFLEEVADFIVAETEAGRLDARTVIVNRRRWTPLGWGPYTGAQHFHVHVDTDGGAPCTP